MPARVFRHGTTLVFSMRRAMSGRYVPKILVLATEKCAYPGADAVGKAHQEYRANVDILRVPSPVMFPEDFYLGCYAKGIDGIMIAACGSDCPYRGAYEKLAKRIDELMSRMKQGGLEVERLRLTAICTVCIKAFLKEISQLNEALERTGPVNREAARALWTQVQRGHKAA
jgi:F420-non-reducing hydrogenase iron-sulfur subunit